MTPPTNIEDKPQQLILLCFHILLFLTPFIWTSFTSELFELPKMIFVYLFTIVITGLWLIRITLTKKVIFTRTFLDLPILLFLVSQILSTLISINPHTSLFGYYSRFHGGLFSTLSYLLLYYAFVSNVSQHHIKNLLTSLLASAVLLSLYAFPEHFGHSPSCALITGEFNASCWVQDVQNRVFGTFGQPNWLAAYLITIIFIPLGLLRHSLEHATLKLTLKHTFLALASILFYLTLLFTKSRSGLMGLAIGSVVFAASLYLIPQISRLKTTKFLGAIYLAAILLFGIFGRNVVPQLNPYLPEFTPSKIQNPSSNIQAGTSLETGGTESGTIRRIVWQGALDLWRQYPILGSGVETFAYAYYQVRPVEHNLVSEWDFLYNKAHNEFLNFLATSGLVGLFSYSLFILMYGWYLISHLRKHPTVAPLFAAFFSGYLALAISNFFGFSTVPVALLFFLLPAMSMVLLKPELPPVIGSDPKPLQYLTIAIISLVSLYMLYQVANMFQADVSYKLGKDLLSSQNIPAAVFQLNDALTRFPQEPNFTESLGLASAQAAILSYQAGNATQAAELAEQAQLIANLNMSQNPANLNYHRTRARIFIHLSQLDPEFINLAIQALDIAQTLAPTDPKITFNLALLHQQQGDTEKALEQYLKAIELKPNYIDARYSLAQLYASLDRLDDAQVQYHYILDQLTPNNPDILKALENLATMSANSKN